VLASLCCSVCSDLYIAGHYFYLYFGWHTVSFFLWSLFQPNMKFLTGLAWDCGAVTTGPVTVPLVLALGIGMCRIVSGGTSVSSGLGVVTLASLSRF